MTAHDCTQLPADLPPDYYRANFEIVLERVRALYSDLLIPREREVLAVWPRLPPAAQCLLVRLLTRKGPLFRPSKLRYPEVGPPLAAAEPLAAAQLVAIDPHLPASHYLPLFSKPECLARLAQLQPESGSLRQLRGLPRRALDQTLTQLLDGVPAFEFCGEPLLALTDCSWFDTFKLLFFGRPGQDLSEFVVRDLGHVKFENYQVDKSLRMFDSRAEIDSQLALHHCGATAEVALAGDAPTLRQWLQQLPEPAPGDTRGARRWQRLVLAGARQLERLGELEEALQHYRRCEMPPARERRARILARAPATQTQALALLQEMAQAPCDEAERQVANDFGARLARQLQKPWPALPRPKPPVEKLTLARTDLPVELAVAAALDERGDCFYVENLLFNTVFGLLYWPAIYAPVRGAFSHPFQAAPLDLYEREFCAARAPWLASIDQQLTSPAECAQLLRARWQEKYGTACPFVAWEAFEWLPIERALRTIPAPHWQAIFRRFLADLREHRSGLPDLIQFLKSGGYRLLEVKAPGDRLQANQLRWMRFFAQAGIPHGVIQVEWRTADQP